MRMVKVLAVVALVMGVSAWKCSKEKEAEVSQEPAAAAVEEPTTPASDVAPQDAMMQQGTVDVAPSDSYTGDAPAAAGEGQPEQPEQPQ